MELQTNVDKKRGALLTLGLHGCFFFYRDTTTAWSYHHRIAARMNF